MSKTTYPDVTLGVHDHSQLKKVAHAARTEGHPVAPFLLAEIRRARVLEDASLGERASLNKQITYRVNFEPAKRHTLMLPEDAGTSGDSISVLSSVGAAMLGLRAGDRMPYRDVFGTLHFVTILRVEPPSPKFTRLRVTSKTDPGGPSDPGPQAA